MPVRIRFEGTRFPHWGAQSGYTQLVRYFDPRRYEVSLRDTPDSDDNVPAWLSSFQVPLKRNIECRMPWYTLGGLNAEAEAFESCLAGRVDIIHLLDGDHSGQFLPRLVRQAHSLGVRTVATLHQPAEVARKVTNVEMLRWLDAVVLVSPSQLPFFRQHVPESKLHVILHGINSEFFCPPPELKPSHQLRCMIAGHWLRDWETFRSVARAMSDVTFIAVPSSTIAFDDLPNVVTHRAVSDATLADLYRSVDVLFLPLIDSTANNALLEGIASGLPVVTTDLEAVRAYLPSGEGIFVAGNRVESFVAALRQLQQNIELRIQMGERARARAEELNWSRVISQYEMLYDKLLATALASAPRLPIDSDSLDLISTDRNSESDGPVHFCENSPLYGSTVLHTNRAAMHRGRQFVADTPMINKTRAAGASNDDCGRAAGLAHAAEQRWQWRMAIAHWAKCVAVAPTSGERIQAISNEARCRVQIGQVGQAKNLLLSIADQYEGLEGLAQIAALEGHERWEQCIIQFPDRIEGFLARATLLIKQGGYAEADALLSHTIGVWPESTRAQALLASSATAGGKLDIAEARWKSVLAEDPKQQDIYFEYARYLAAVADRPAADAYLASFVDRPVAMAEFLLEYALVREDWSTAIGQARALIALEKWNLWHRLRLAVLLTRLPLGTPEALKAGLAMLRELCACSPDAVSVKGYLIEAYIRAGFEREAEDAMQTLPSEDKRLQLEIFRAWSLLRANGDFAAKERWKVIFLCFGLIQSSDMVFGIAPPVLLSDLKDGVAGVPFPSGPPSARSLRLVG